MKTWNVIKSILLSIGCLSVGIGWVVVGCYCVARAPKVIGYFMLGVFGAVVIGAIALGIYQSISE